MKKINSKGMMPASSRLPFLILSTVRRVNLSKLVGNAGFYVALECIYLESA